ncbi:MAG: ABC transporter substrate-binding protein [Kiloniellales bacterium]
MMGKIITMNTFLVKTAALIALGVTLAIAGCAPSTEIETAETNRVRIGTEGAYPPFNYVNANGNLAGFDVDIANALCTAAKLECEFVIQDWDGIIPGLLAKKYDAIVASMSITEERKRKVDFTKKYYHMASKFVAKKGSTFEFTPQGLSGKSVAVQRGTLHERLLRDTFPGVSLKLFDTQDEANSSLAAGHADLVMASAVMLLEGFLKTRDGADFEFVGPNWRDARYHGRGVAIAVRKTDSELRETLNQAIDQIRADGTYQWINDEYFPFDIYGGPEN